mmetsp:Transcript_27372/g.50796  ORF Transcript_27372/g.50796 Transcript_27372/m.50796 type:complete len:200 (+) Transcript_27372:1013-1612(+)
MVAHDRRGSRALGGASLVRRRRILVKMASGGGWSSFHMIREKTARIRSVVCSFSAVRPILRISPTNPSSALRSVSKPLAASTNPSLHSLAAARTELATSSTSILAVAPVDDFVRGKKDLLVAPVSESFRETENDADEDPLAAPAVGEAHLRAEAEAEAEAILASALSISLNSATRSVVVRSILRTMGSTRRDATDGRHT